MTGSLAWPTAFVVLISVFRKQVQLLIPKISEMSIFGSSLTFSQELQKAEQEAQAQALPTPPQPQPEPQAPALRENYIEQAREFPEGAVMEAFKDVERFLQDYRKTIGKEASTPMPNSYVVRTILRNSPNRDQVIALYSQLSKTRNLAVHASGGTITASEALAYKDLCKGVIQLLSSAVLTDKQQTELPL